MPAFNATVWATAPAISPQAHPAHLLAVLAPVGLYLAGGVSGWPPLLYPLSILAVIGVPILLGALGTVLFASFTSRANRATDWRSALPAVLGGLLLAGPVFGPGPLVLLPR